MDLTRHMSPLTNYTVADLLAAVDDMLNLPIPLMPQPTGETISTNNHCIQLVITDDESENQTQHLSSPSDCGKDLLCFHMHIGFGKNVDVTKMSAAYQPTLYSAGTVASMVDSWRACCGSIDAPTRCNDSRTLNSLPVMGQVQQERVTKSFNNTTHMFPEASGGCLHAMFEARVRRNPNAMAVECRNKTATYAELNESANRLARDIIGMFVDQQHVDQARKVEVPPRLLVAVFLERSIAVYVAMLAAMKIGGAYVSVDPAYPRERVRYTLDNSKAAVIVTTAELLASLGDAVSPTCKVVLVDPTFSVTAAALVGETTCSDIVDTAMKELGRGCSPIDQCYVIYTSGSTGNPKGVAISHCEACNFVLAESLIYGMVPSDRVLQGFSTAFDASVEEIWMAFHAGATLVVGTKELMQSGPDFPQNLAELNITVLSTVPTLLSSMDPSQATDVRLIIVGGEACTQHVIDQWGKGRLFFNTYGPTEATVVATYHLCVPGMTHERVKIGRPLANVRCHVLDGQMNPVPQGALGELYIGGAGVSSRGYVGLPEHNTKRFVSDPFAEVHFGSRRHRDLLYKTGDQVRYDCDGALEFHGRLDSQVKVRGFRIELSGKF